MIVVIRMSNLTVSYVLNRSSGKNSSLAKGNEMISSNDRLHHIVKSQITSHLRELASETDFLADHYEVPRFTPENKCYIVVVVNPPTNRRMDSPNWYPTVKALIDGLSDAGIFEDDDDSVISSVTFIRGQKTDNKKYRLDLHIRAGILDIEGDTDNGRPNERERDYAHAT